MGSGFRFRGLLFRIGSSTFAKKSVLEGVSVEKPEKGKGKNRSGYFPGVRSSLEFSAIRLQVLQPSSKANVDGCGVWGPNSALVMYISTEMDP